MCTAAIKFGGCGEGEEGGVAEKKIDPEPTGNLSEMVESFRKEMCPRRKVRQAQEQLRIYTCGMCSCDTVVTALSCNWSWLCTSFQADTKLDGSYGAKTIV